MCNGITYFRWYYSKHPLLAGSSSLSSWTNLLLCSSSSNMTSSILHVCLRYLHQHLTNILIFFKNILLSASNFRFGESMTIASTFSSSSAFKLRLFRPFLHFLFVSFLFGIWKFCASYFKRTIWPSLTTTCWSSSESEESMKSFADLSSKSKLVVSTSDRSIYCFQRLSKFWCHVYFAITFATRPYQALNNHEH